MNAIYLGHQPFTLVRKMQNYAVTQRLNNQIADTLFFCEHEAVITFGKRLPPEAFPEQQDDWRSRGIALHICDRGGEATYHGPGQLMLYPVVQLRGRGLGVRRFVELVFEAMSQSLAIDGLSYASEFPGLWIGGVSGRKIASVGLRMHHGVTNHGFSLNLSCDLDGFRGFDVCGMPEANVSSLQVEDPDAPLSLECWAWRLRDAVSRTLEEYDEQRAVRGSARDF